MRSGSIGLAGSRGAGKTTLIRAVCGRRDASDRRLTTVMEAPVRYDPRDFVLALMTQVCDEVLRTDAGARGEVRNLRYSRRGRTRVVIAALVTALIASAVLAWVAAEVQSDAVTRVITYAVAAAVPLGTALLLLRPRRRAAEVPSPDERLATRAREELHEARWQQSYSHGYAGKLGLPVGAEVSVQSGSDITRKQRSFPEIVDALRSMLADAAATRGGVVIGIDEMDKMESGEVAQQFLNEIKGVFGVDGCFYLVSISEGAMSAFERRGLPFRDVFDSAFDEIVHVEPLPRDQSALLLRRRVIGLGSPFVDLCHCLSGGLPRDLLRLVRQLSLMNGLPDTERRLQRVAGELVRLELVRKTEAALVAVQQGACEPAASDLLGWLHRFLDGGGADRLERLATALPARWPPPAETHGGEGLERLRVEHAAFVYFLATVLRVFASPAIWRAGEDRIEPLAEARAAFAVNPRLAVSLLEAIREPAGGRAEACAAGRRAGAARPG